MNFIKLKTNHSNLEFSDFDFKFMQLSLEMADKAEKKGEVPVGAVLVDANNKIIACGYNQVISLSDPSAHAEIIALREAGKILQNYRLLNCTLYVTLEPCAMCAGAILHSRIKRLVFATSDKKTGAVGSRFHLFTDFKMNHLIEVQGGLLAKEAKQKLQQFFQNKRK